MHKRAMIAGFVLVLLGACGSGDDGPGAAADGHDHSHEHSQDEGAGAGEGFVFGVPGEPGAATRTVEVTARDPYSFEPTALRVDAGETVTFVVSNEGEQPHEFVLGDRAYQDAHEEEMASGEMHHEGNAVTLEPGETQELTWTFPAAGEVLFGCHVPGHYQGGMVGAIRVRA